MERLSDTGRRIRAWMRFGAAPAIAVVVLLLGYGADVAAQNRNTWIAFVTMRDGDHEIYAMRPDGTGLRNLTRSPALDVAPMWSPARRRLAFWSTRDGGNAVYTMEADGSGVRKLLTMPPDTSGRLAWSPDGKRFAFASKRDGNYRVYVMDADGGRQRRITKDVDTWVYDATWSPNGRRVGFTSNRNGPRTIFSTAADGQIVDPKPLVIPAAIEEHPAWSPDGRRVAFLSRIRDHFHKDVWVADVGGANAENLMPDPDGERETDGSRPAWSPDGRQIVYGSGQLGVQEPDVLITNVDDPDPRNLTEHPAHDGSPLWFDPRGLPVSPLHSRLTTWGWMKQLGADPR